MAVTQANSYFSGKIWINCKGGGFTETYNLATQDPLVAQLVVKNIAKLRMYVTERYSRVANAIVSVEQQVGNNPADAINLPHDQFFKPILMTAQLPALAAETVPATAADPAIGIFWKLDTGIGFVEKRILRAIRSTWIVDNKLIVTGVTPLALNGASTATVTSIDPGVALQNYFSYVRDNTVYVQKTPNGTTKFNLITFSAGYLTPGLGPDWSVVRISRRPVGYAWPKVAGRQPSFS